MEEEEDENQEASGGKAPSSPRRENVWVYACVPLSPFEALAPRVCVHYFVWAGDCVSLCVWARIRGACAESESALDCVGGRFCESMHTLRHSRRLRRDCVALDCVGGRFCESMHMGPYRHSRRLRREWECSGLCVRDILRIYAYAAPFEALAPRLCVLWIVCAGCSASQCIWAPIAIRGACAEIVCALDCVGGRLCKSMHMGPYRHSRRLRCGSGVLIILWRLRGCGLKLK
jgi:hypothetical protein